MTGEELAAIKARDALSACLFDSEKDRRVLLAALRDLLEALEGHGVCSCAGIVPDQGGPRPIGGGRFYHYTGCDDDPILRAAIEGAS